jgi:hypothetical protein
MAPFSAQDFYDQLAEDYHLIYPDWSVSVSRQGGALEALPASISTVTSRWRSWTVPAGSGHRRSAWPSADTEWWPAI